MNTTFSIFQNIVETHTHFIYHRFSQQVSMLQYLASEATFYSHGQIRRDISQRQPQIFSSQRIRVFTSRFIAISAY
jgi:hypothetical protein